jgi:pSer/pThr/pTyr-binding forkhead associated (FHA) protein
MTTTPTPTWVLEGADADETLTFRMTPGSVRTIGRAPTADFILDVPLVSRLHCRLTAYDDRLEVVDLGSTNGTKVNEAIVPKADLRAGDRVRVGRVELTLRRDA